MHSDPMEYYYNNVPEKGLCRNNLIYTSLINNDKTVFCQWFYNDKNYHKDQNQIVDPKLMDEKWEREVNFLTLMSENYPEHVPQILEIDHSNKKIFLRINGSDFWQESGCNSKNFDKVCPDWRKQIIEIIQSHYKLGFHKYSMHPSSFFLINGKLKSINYFFSYFKTEPYISIKHVESHIHLNRQIELKKYLSDLKINWHEEYSWNTMDKLCWLSFQNNYPIDFINQVLDII